MNIETAISVIHRLKTSEKWHTGVSWNISEALRLEGERYGIRMVWTMHQRQQHVSRFFYGNWQTGLIDTETAKCQNAHWFYNLLTGETQQINLQYTITLLCLRWREYQPSYVDACTSHVCTFAVAVAATVAVVVYGYELRFYWKNGTFTVSTSYLQTIPSSCGYRCRPIQIQL